MISLLVEYHCNINICQVAVGNNLLDCKCGRGFSSSIESTRFRHHALQWLGVSIPTVNSAPVWPRVVALQRFHMRRVRGLHKLLPVANELNLNFAVVTMEQLTLHEQIERWSKTDVVISCSAAALMFLVIMPPGSHYVVVPHTVKSRDIVGECFYTAYAMDLQVQFHPLCGRTCTYLHDIGRTRQLCGHLHDEHGKHFMDHIEFWLYKDIKLRDSHVAEFRRILGSILGETQVPSPRQ